MTQTRQSSERRHQGIKSTKPYFAPQAHWMQHRTRNPKLETSQFHTNALPSRTEREGIRVMSAPRSRSGYCLSYTAVLLNFLPCESVPLVVTVRVLPSADTTIRPVTVTFPPFLI